MATTLIGLGSNMGDRAATLDAALEQLAALPGVSSVAASRYYDYPAVGGPQQGAFLNAAARVETSLLPAPLLAALRQIEDALGRHRLVHWGPRSVDLDLLLYDAQVIDTPQLQVPHPRLAVRRFVLEPASEVAADLVHPTIGWSIGRLLKHAREHRRYLALAGPIGVGKTQLAAEVLAALGQRHAAAGTMLAEPIDDELLARFYANPSGLAWDAELEFLRSRTELLAAHGSVESPGWAVSDFWFDQSLAYADLWLPPQQRAAYDAQFQAAAQRVIRPKLLVVLDAPTEELQRRIARRGRPYEAHLDNALLDRQRQLIVALAARRDQGPVLYVSAVHATDAVAEVIAAVEGMDIEGMK